MWRKNSLKLLVLTEQVSVRAAETSVSWVDWCGHHVHRSQNYSSSTCGRSFMSAISLCTIAVFHQIYNLRIIPSSIYNHCFSLLWYFPSPCSLISSDAIAGAPVAVYKVEGWGFFFSGRTSFFGGGAVFYCVGQNLSLSDEQATNNTRTKLTHNNLRQTQSFKKKKEKTSQEISSSSPNVKDTKRIKNVIYSFVLFFFCSCRCIFVWIKIPFVLEIWGVCVCLLTVCR